MFERIVLRQSELGPPVSFGDIAEAMIFYRRVQLILDRGVILHLIRQIGINNFFRLIEMEKISATYIEQHLGTMTQRVGLIDSHNFVAFSLEGRAPRRLSKKERAANIFVQFGCDRRQSVRYAERLLKSVKPKSVTNDDFTPGGIVQAAKTDIKDPQFTRQAIGCAIETLLPIGQELPDFRFEVYEYGQGFQVVTDLDFDWINSKQSTQGSEITAAFLLSNVLTACSDLALAAYYGGDFKASSVSSEIIKVKCAGLLRRTDINAQEISSFRDVVLSDLPAISEVLNARERSPEDFFTLLESANRFGGWTSSLSPDDKLVSEYLKFATSAGWVATLPGKSVRFVIGTAIGVANPIAGALASLADSFAVERLLGGWRPSHFVDRKLKPFLDVER